MAQRQLDGNDEHAQLFASLNDEFRHVLTVIARVSEQAADAPANTQVHQWSTIRDVANAAAQLSAAYGQIVRSRNRTASLDLEPITISSVFRTVYNDLAPYAQQYGVALELDMSPRLGLIMSDEHVLRQALTCIGQVLVHGQAESGSVTSVVLSAHRSRHGVVAGVYTADMPLTKSSLRRARHIFGKADMPLGSVVSGSATGLFLAETLLRTITARLHLGKYHSRTGLAVTLPVCQQLHIV